MLVDDAETLRFQHSNTLRLLRMDLVAWFYIIMRKRGASIASWNLDRVP
jgi:hypothetical protein